MDFDYLEQKRILPVNFYFLNADIKSLVLGAFTLFKQNSPEGGRGIVPDLNIEKRQAL